MKQESQVLGLQTITLVTSGYRKKKMIAPSRMVSFMKPVLTILLIIFFIGFLVTWLSTDEEDDDFSVTITYDCARVLAERGDPPEVIAECLELQDEIKGRNRH